MLRLELNSNGVYDLARDEGGVGLANDGDLSTIATVALCTFARARDGEIRAGEDPRGWWGNSYPDDPGYELGGRLWLLEGAKTTNDVLDEGESHVREALQFMVDDGLVSAISATSSRVGYDTYQAEIFATAPDGESEAFRLLWEATLLNL